MNNIKDMLRSAHSTVRYPLLRLLTLGLLIGLSALVCKQSNYIMTLAYLWFKCRHYRYSWSFLPIPFETSIFLSQFLYQDQI